jgi:hypothetical protein
VAIRHSYDAYSKMLCSESEDLAIKDNKPAKNRMIYSQFLEPSVHMDWEETKQSTQKTRMAIQASITREYDNSIDFHVPDLTGQVKLVNQYPVYEANYSDVFLGVWKDPKKHQKVSFQPFLPHCILNQDLVSGESYSGSRAVS